MMYIFMNVDFKLTSAKGHYAFAANIVLCLWLNHTGLMKEQFAKLL